MREGGEGREGDGRGENANGEGWGLSAMQGGGARETDEPNDTARLVSIAAYSAAMMFSSQTLLGHRSGKSAYQLSQ